MFAIKTKARWLTHGAKSKTMLLTLLPLAALIGAAICFFTAVMAFAYGADTVFATYPFAGLLQAHDSLRRLTPWLFLAAGGVFTLLFSAARFTMLSFFYYRTDHNQTRPARFLSLKMAMRALHCTALLALRKSGWALLLFSPALLTAAALFLLLRYRGLPPALLWAGLGLAAGQALAGAGGYFVLSGRYCVTRYLMYLNPLLPAREAVNSAVLLTRGKRPWIALCRLSMLPWRALCLFSVTRPFAFAYTRLTHAVLCETLYAEDKTKFGRPAAVFFVGDKKRRR